MVNKIQGRYRCHVSRGSSLLLSPGLQMAELGVLKIVILENTESEVLIKLTLQYQCTESTSSWKVSASLMVYSSVRLMPHGIDGFFRALRHYC